MTEPIDSHDYELWNRVVEAERVFINARSLLLRNAGDIVKLIHEAIDKPSERPTALGIAKYLRPQQLQALFPDLLELASFLHGQTAYAIDLILTFPRKWVLLNIENSATRILEQGGGHEYEMLLELYCRLDRDLTVRLAQKAASHPEADVREAGRSALKRLLSVDL